MARKKLPFNSVKIGYVDAKVNGISGREAEKRAIYGEYFSKSQELDYDIDMAEGEKVNAIVHEILHGIVHVWGVRFSSHDQEEEVVNALGGALATVFSDNPKLVKWIMDTFHSDFEDDEEE